MNSFEAGTYIHQGTYKTFSPNPLNRNWLIDDMSVISLLSKAQVYKDDMHIFPVDYFCPLTSTRVLKCTKNTYCIHHFAGSWQEKTRGQLVKGWIVEHIIGRKLTDKIVQLKRKFFG